MALETATLRRLRNQIPDTYAGFGATEDKYLFTDLELEDFFTDASETHPASTNVSRILRAAGFANLAMSTNEAIISKVIKTQDLATDGAKLAAELRQNAKVLFDRADEIDMRAVVDYFEIVDFNRRYSTRAELTEYSQESYFD